MIEPIKPLFDAQTDWTFRRDILSLHFYLVLFIKLAFVAVCSKQKSRNPGRRSSHLLTNGIHRYFFAAFDDQLVMYMAADKARFSPMRGFT